MLICFRQSFSVGKQPQQQQNHVERNSPTKAGEQSQFQQKQSFIKAPCFNQVSDLKSQKFQDCIAKMEEKQNNTSQEFITQILQENLKLQKQIQESNQTIRLLMRKAKTPEICSTGLKKFLFDNDKSSIKDNNDQFNQTIQNPLQLNKKAVSAIINRVIANKKSMNLNNVQRGNTSEQLDRSAYLTKASLKINFQLPPIDQKLSKTPLSQIKKQAYFPRNNFKSDNNLPNANELKSELQSNVFHSEENYQLIPHKKSNKIAIIKQVFASKPLKKFL